MLSVSQLWGTYLQSDSPFAYIDKSKQQALRLRDFTKVMPGNWPEIEVAAEAVSFIRDHLKEKCEVATNHERRFLELYFEFCRKQIAPPSYMQRLQKERRDWSPPYNDDDWHIVRILNTEITKYGTKVVERLLPSEITQFWKSSEEKWRSNPFSTIPF